MQRHTGLARGDVPEGDLDPRLRSTDHHLAVRSVLRSRERDPRELLAHDIRLDCHGLDKVDNDFVVGLIGKDLHPLSHIVQSMRRTQQTSLYLERLGPFFVGRAIWQFSA